MNRVSSALASFFAFAMLAVSPAFGGGIAGFPCYRTVDETFAAASSLAQRYPALVEIRNIGSSWEQAQNPSEGDDLLVLRLTNRNHAGPKPILFVSSALHARELATAELNLRFGEYLLAHYGSDADATWLLDEQEIHLLLQANPDGRRQAEAGLLWRKNTDDDYCGGGTARGIDLNRNFEYGWSCCGGAGDSPCDELYRGPAAGSEPETFAYQLYLRFIFPAGRSSLAARGSRREDGLLVDLHSYGRLVMWPYSFGGASPDDTEFKTLGRKLAFFNTYRPQQASDLYVADGTAVDFAYGELGVAGITIELGSTFFQDCQIFVNGIFPINLPALLFAAKASRAPYLLPAGPEPLDLKVSASVVASGNPVTVTARLDDTRFSAANGVEPRSAIAEARLTIDDPPWSATQPEEITMPALDGSLDQEIETVSAEIDTEALAVGRHTVFVRGRDSQGNWGVVSAVFFEVVEPNSLRAPGMDLAMLIFPLTLLRLARWQRSRRGHGHPSRVSSESAHS